MVAMEPSPGAYKKATASLDEAARARLRGPFVSNTRAPSSAPPGRADADNDDLADLVDQFYNGYGEQGTECVVAARDPVPPRRAEWKDTLRAALADAAVDAVAARIRAEAERVVQDAGPDLGCCGGSRKLLVERLRARGFNAGLCKSTWQKSSSVPPAGTYEYVDVMVCSSPRPSYRYIVEVNVAAEFDIARPSTEYQALLLSLPPVLVARPEAFNELAVAMCAAAAESIRGAGMHVAPWRRAQYVQAKRSGQYERTEAVAPVAKTGSRQEAVTPVTTAGARQEAVAPLTTAGARQGAVTSPVATARARQETVTSVATTRARQGAVAPAVAAAGAPQEAGKRAVVHARRPVGRKNCGMEMERRVGAMGWEALANVRPLFRGL